MEDLYISSFKDLYAASLLRNNEEIVTSLVFGKVEEAIIIILLVTQPNHRNRGCAEFLLELVKDEHKYSCLYTQVKNDNMAAKQFYQKVGFVQNNGRPLCRKRKGGRVVLQYEIVRTYEHQPRT